MTNTFITTDLVVRDASIILADNLVMAMLSNRSHEQEYAKKVGSTISIKVPPQQTARDLIDDGMTTTDNDITETSVDLTLSEEPYIAHTLTTSDKSLELDDFSVVVSEPAVLAIRDAIDTFIAKQAVRGFSRYTAGTEGNQPSTVAHMLAGRKEMQDNGAPLKNRVGVVNTTAEASFLQLTQFQSSDYGSERPAGLKEATMGRLFGYDWFADQNMAVLDRGDVTEATNVMGAGQSGSTLIVDDAGTTSAGTISEGSRFLVAGDTQVYTVLADSTAAAGSFSLTVGPAIAVAPADDAALTWKAANTGNIMYTKNALGAAIVPPAPLAVNSSVAFYNGIGLRVTMSSSTSSMSDQIVYDTYCGSVVIERKGGAVLQG